MSDAAEDDPFWSIALEYGDSRHAELAQEESDDSVDELVSDRKGKQIYRVYRLPRNGPCLHLASLPLSDGIWSPLGSEAWYGSALLTALFDQTMNCEQSNESRLYQVIHNKSRRGNMRCLELGSGAVGLSGFACGVLLGSREMGGPSEHSLPEIILTDNDDALLKQLETNLARNHLLFVDKAQVSVQKLDWNTPDSFVGSNGDKNLDLVIGSELVYSNDTASACASCILRLFDQWPNLLILIVQIADRPGWDWFLTQLREHGLQVDNTNNSIYATCHDVASKMIQMGGTLSRFDYAATCITKPTCQRDLEKSP